MNHNDQFQHTLQQLIELWMQLSTCLANNPDKLIKHQMSFWQAYGQLCLEAGLEPIENHDKRFQNKQWQENSSLNFIRRSYLLLSEHMYDFIDTITEKSDNKAAAKLKFYIRQFIDACSPTNFAHLNPDVLTKTLETNGENLLSGMKQLAEDMKKGNGLLNIKMTDTNHFKVGETIACTPGKVVFQNDVMQLIQYSPTTASTHQIPLLIIPPWINKFYILDLQQENSFVKFLVDQGMTVFMLSWVNANSQHRKKTFSHYMVEGPLTAINVINEIMGDDKLNVLGYCVGGTMLGCSLAYLAKKNDSRVISATFLTTLLDFSEPGDLGTFIDDTQLKNLDKDMLAKGYLDGNIMASVFTSLRANDLVWSAYINQYLKGEQPKAFDLLHWNADPTNIPRHVHHFYLRNMYIRNRLVEPDKLKVAGVTLDLSKINIPAYFLAAQDDHIVPWRSAYKSSQAYGGNKKFVLTTSGHVAGVINPPVKKKYGYWMNNATPVDADKYLESASFTPGSWWINWVEWLKQYAGDMRPAQDFHTGKKYEDAPGSYVKVRLTEIS